MFSKAWKANQQSDAGGHQPAEQVVGPHGDAAGPPQDDAEQQRRCSAGADEAELLPRDREDEVGLLLGHELALGLRAVEQALAVEAAGADRDRAWLML